MTDLLARLDAGLQNIGLGVEPALTILIFFLILIFASRDIRTALLVGLILFAVAFIVGSSIGLDTSLFAAGVLLSFAFLTLSLMVRKNQMGVV